MHSGPCLAGFYIWSIWKNTFLWQGSVPYFYMFLWVFHLEVHLCHGHSGRFWPKGHFLVYFEVETVFFFVFFCCDQNYFMPGRFFFSIFRYCYEIHSLNFEYFDSFKNIEQKKFSYDFIEYLTWKNYSRKIWNANNIKCKIRREDLNGQVLSLFKWRLSLGKIRLKK